MAYSHYRRDYITYKYFGDQRCLMPIQRAVDEYQVDIIIDDFIFLPPKKSHHIDSLVRLVARKFGMPYYYCFEYVRPVMKNCKLDAWERHHNVKHALTVRQLPPDMYYVLFDDIVTSGATFLEMRRALLEHGVSADQICGLTFFNSKY